MSYRDLRNFSEAMRALGFPRPISLESFRSPNFALMEEAVRWLAARLEPDATLAGAGSAVEQRVAFVTHAVSFFLSRGNVKLSGRRLYGADGWAARELLKVATLLRAALRAPSAALDQGQGGDGQLYNYDISGRLGEIKQARQLSTELTARGAFLYELLAKEPEHKSARDEALSRPLDMSTMEASLRRALDALSARVSATRDHTDSVASSEAALDSKLQRRRQELQRAEKRLRTVASIKPAYQPEVSMLEGELQQLWERYVLRYRCVEALKHQLSLLENAQAEAAEEQQAAIMQLIHKYEAEDVLGKLSDSEEMSSSDETKDLSEVRPATRAPRPATRPRTRLRIKTAGAQATEERRAFGSMAGGARGSLDDIRDEDDSLSEGDDSDRATYGRESTMSRWPRPRPATRTLAADDDLRDLMEGVSGGGGGDDSLGSSSESELRLVSAARRTSAAPGRSSVLSDNEF